jgi:protein lysine acetyltransferase
MPNPEDVPSVNWLDALDQTDAGARLSTAEFVPDDVVLREGEVGDFFFVVINGEFDVYRSNRHIARLGPGSVVGELSLITGVPRSTTVIACSTVIAKRGSAEDFAELLECDAIRDHFANVAAARLAANVDAVPFVTKADFLGELRPLLPSDRHAYLELLSKLSPRSRRLRFFTPAPPTERMINYFLDIDFIDHFAWVVLDRSTSPHTGCGVARFIRSTTDPQQAEAAFVVIDDYQSRGIGTVMLGAVAVAADAVGITTLTAEVLDENESMRAVFGRVEPIWTRLDRGVLQATMSVDRARGLLTPQLDAALRSSVLGLGFAAEIGLRV